MVSWLGHSLRGACMGIADTIPGVSGGTLALVLGIYERFIAAVSAVGPRMLRLALTGEFWRRLAAGLREPGAEGRDEVGIYAAHALFLAFLGVGILAALLVSARFIPTLLDLYPAQMKGFFLGLVLASVMIPFRAMRRRGAAQVAALVLAAVGTFFFVGMPIDQSEKATGDLRVELAAPAPQELTLTPQSVVFMTARHGGDSEKREVAFGPTGVIHIPAGATHAAVRVQARMAGEVANLAAGQVTIGRGLPAGATVSQPVAMAGGEDPALLFLFIGGVIAISAMVLPGLSGAFLLLMLGLYHYVTFNVRALVYDQDPKALLTVGVFALAVLIGITTFSRVLTWLFNRWHDTTMAVLVGLMLGSLRKIWPFTGTVDDGTEIATLPAAVDATALVTLALFVVGVAVVLGLDIVGRRHRAAG